MIHVLLLDNKYDIFGCLQQSAVFISCYSTIGVVLNNDVIFLKTQSDIKVSDVRNT